MGQSLYNFKGGNQWACPISTRSTLHIVWNPRTMNVLILQAFVNQKFAYFRDWRLSWSFVCTIWVLVVVFIMRWLWIPSNIFSSFLACFQAALCTDPVLLIPDSLSHLPLSSLFLCLIISIFQSQILIAVNDSSHIGSLDCLNILVVALDFALQSLPSLFDILRIWNRLSISLHRRYPSHYVLRRASDLIFSPARYSDHHHGEPGWMFDVAELMNSSALLTCWPTRALFGIVYN